MAHVSAGLVGVPGRPDLHEGRFAAEAACWILLATFLLSGATRDRPDPVEPLRAYQVGFQDLPFEAQRTARALLAGIDEVCASRGADGTWPPGDVLSADELLGPGRTVRGRDAGDAALYLVEGSPAWLVELAPAGAVGTDPAHLASLAADGRHRRSPDGSLVHLAIWVGPPGRPAGFPFQPALEGWREVVLVPGGKAP